MMGSLDKSRAKTGRILLALWTVVSFGLLFSLDRQPQDPEYHNFSDNLTIFAIPNFFNVISNLPFLIVGLMGLSAIWKKQIHPVMSENQIAYSSMFAGVAFVAFGSGYYHLDPDNASLLWDRLPMTIAFMSLVSIIISEFISQRWGKNLLVPLVISGLASVLYWFVTEQRGIGDLRPYIFVQFYPIVAIPIILFFFRPSYTLISGYWWLLLCYFMAKVLEFFDIQIHEILSFLSGHSIKHVIAAVGLLILLRSYRLRSVA